MFPSSLPVCLIHYPPNILSTKGFEIEFRALLNEETPEAELVLV
jgi:hypothetical protein